MLIDFHIHLFPDALAERTLSHLSGISKVTPTTDGTLAGTLAAMDRWGVRHGVVLQIATKEAQQKTINDCAKEIQDGNPRLSCFGSVYPPAESAVEELYRIRDMGLCGVKLHPAYQSFHFGNERCYPVYETAEKLGLPMTIHAGWDPYDPCDNYAPPEEIARVAKAFPRLTIIAAHMGGINCWEEAAGLLAPLPNLFCDTAMSSVLLHPELYRNLIRRYGAERILLGSDCPWNTIPDELASLRSLGLTDRELDQITFENACRLLKINPDSL